MVLVRKRPADRHKQFVNQLRNIMKASGAMTAATQTAAFSHGSEQYAR